MVKDIQNNMNNPKDNAGSADGNWGKTLPSVAQGKASSKKKELAKKIKGGRHQMEPAYPRKGIPKEYHFFKKMRPDVEKNSPLE